MSSVLRESQGIEQEQWSWKYPHNVVDHAVRELIDKGLIEELPDLGCRYRLVEIEVEKKEEA